MNKKIVLKYSISLIIIFLTLYLMTIIPNFPENTNTISSPDLILDNVGVFDLTFLYVYVFIFIVILTVYLVFKLEFKNFPYIGIIFSLLMLIRLFFMNLTILNFPQNGIMPSFPGILQNFVFHNDLFFSGHVSFPFMSYLIFYDNIHLRYLFLILTIVMGIIVLLMHVHYSIDAFAAPFITYGVFVFSEKYLRWFKNE